MKTMNLGDPRSDAAHAPRQRNQEKKYQSSALHPREAERIYRALRHYMEEEYGYQQEDLTVHLLAGYLETNAKYLIQVVNQRLGLSFRHMVNRYRIREFQQRLADGEAKYYTFFGLARECGFANRTTFYRAYRRFVGRTPKRR